MHIKTVLLAPAIALALVAATPAAQAVDATRVEYPNAGAFCQGALPAFAGTLRTRPLAVVNEGDQPAFLTCSFSGGISSRFTYVYAFVINAGSV